MDWTEEPWTNSRSWPLDWAELRTADVQRAYGRSTILPNHADPAAAVAELVEAARGVSAPGMTGPAIARLRHALRHWEGES